MADEAVFSVSAFRGLDLGGSYNQTTHRGRPTGRLAIRSTYTMPCDLSTTEMVSSVHSGPATDARLVTVTSLALQTVTFRLNAPTGTLVRQSLALGPDTPMSLVTGARVTTTVPSTFLASAMNPGGLQSSLSGLPGSFQLSLRTDHPTSTNTLTFLPSLAQSVTTSTSGTPASATAVSTPARLPPNRSAIPKEDQHLPLKFMIPIAVVVPVLSVAVLAAMIYWARRRGIGWMGVHEQNLNEG
ncbi:hypothetical protein GQ43DRAFT_434259 [Delitschia confertaspora ATCC 74209]|uniref:Uncharacterized protein n=1 Tax=Delitschia confertaspora ATCC 74209 TaxID=1513339 RepID=A0A9P4JFJ4_9PLEO|nr:hypothetical protein GQ43DRAFT_434259 [Delitschia confertaspora ATCC 74209]